jgi:hypothetical protein
MRVCGINFPKERRVNRGNRCPICGHADWCIISADGEYVLCPRIEDGAFRTAGCGNIHRLNGQARKMPISGRPKAESYEPERIRRIYSKLDFSDKALRPLAERLGLEVWPLQMLGVGYKVGVWYTPTVRFGKNGKPEITGLLKRRCDGFKFSEKGSQLGVIIGRNFFERRGSEIVVCEGTSDCATMLQLGYRVIGKPSVRIGDGIITQIARMNPSGDSGKIIIVADDDSDKPEKNSSYKIGLKRAVALANRFPQGRARIMINPDYKDVRQWYLSGTFSYSDFNKCCISVRQAAKMAAV